MDPLVPGAHTSKDPKSTDTRGAQAGHLVWHTGADLTALSLRSSLTRRGFAISGIVLFPCPLAAGLSQVRAERVLGRRKISYRLLQSWGWPRICRVRGVDCDLSRECVGTG